MRVLFGGSARGRPQSIPALLTLALLLAVPSPSPAEEAETVIREGCLDEIRLKGAERPKEAGVILRTFSTDKASFGTAEEGDHQERIDAAQAMKRDAPRIFAETILQSLTMGGPFPFARESEESVPENGIVVEGRFTVIDPGSRAKRWALVGTTGRTRVEVEGVVKNAKGEVLAEFRHMRVSGFGLTGGKYIDFLTNDTKDVALDVAIFLKRWASGGNLREKAK